MSETELRNFTELTIARWGTWGKYLGATSPGERRRWYEAVSGKTPWNPNRGKKDTGKGKIAQPALVGA